MLHDLGIIVIFPIPPIFWSAKFLLLSLYNKNSLYGTNGAPSPPAAISITLKLDITFVFVSYAITAGSPIWSVEDTKLL